MADARFSGSVALDEPLAGHTTYRIGGPADMLVRVDTVDALALVFQQISTQGIPWTVLGRGSNLLVSDSGYRGCAITLGSGFSDIAFVPERFEFRVGAAAPLSGVVKAASGQGMSGMEFACGTPGTVGGALRMNAGTASDGIGCRVVELRWMMSDATLHRCAGSDIDWSYRSSSIPVDAIVLDCVLAVHPGEPDAIRGTMDAALARRKASQPLEYPSCGSVFRNPAGQSAGALIQDVGLKGRRCGGAQISEKHANFIVNRGDAKASEVAELIDTARREVKRVYGIELQPEVRFLGFTS